jgi:hypothetical protein
MFGISTTMFTKHKIYYSVEVKDGDDDSFRFICSYATFTEAKQKLDELESNDYREYRILKVEKLVEEVS